MDTRNICPACNALYDRTVFVCVRCGTGLLEIPDAPLLSGTTLDMRYDIEGVVGTGGMGTVYKARQRGMEREVAIKVLHPRFAHEPRAVKRFFREAQAASRLIHPHIVTVYDFGRAAEGHLYMVMELLEGFTLGDLVHYRAPLPAALALAILNQVCEALEEAHRQRLVHRDLKPDNILLSSTEDGLWAKVLDFGIARAMREPEGEGGLSRASLDKNHSTVEIAGTPAYMSPEQILGREPDPRSDLYSLGIILFEMLTRQRPFDDEHSVTLCMKQLNEAPRRISEVKSDGSGTPVPAVSEAVERLVKALLEKAPEQRPQRASDVRALIAKCPESSFPFSLPELGLDTGARPLSVKTTRAEPIFVADKTSDLGAAAAARQEPTAKGLTAVLDRQKPAKPTELSGPSQPTMSLGGAGAATAGTQGAATANTKGAATTNNKGSAYARPAAPRAQDRVEPKVERKVSKAAERPGAVAQIVAEHPGALATGELAGWLLAKESEGWEVQRDDRRALVKIPGADAADAMRRGGRDLASLQERALAVNLGLRIGLAPIDEGQVALAIDLARRLAVATTHGQVAVPATTAGRTGMAVRPQTTIFLPNGQPQECAVLRREAASPDGDEDSALLWGRGLQLRRLGQLGDEALRQGPTLALIQGARGMGKTSLLNAFLNGRQAVRVRVSPVAAAWPGHTLAQLVAAALDLPPLRGRIAELDQLAWLELGDRERELFELLLLDRPVVEPPRARALARMVHDVLAKKAAEGGALVIAVDDAHFLDRASREVFQQVVKLAQAAARPWCFVATARWVKPESFLAEAPRVDLRPLGLRAMNQLAEALKIPPRQRHGFLAASQGNPLTLALLSQAARGQEPSAHMHQLGEGLLPWLLTSLLRAADPREADRAWLGAALGEGGPTEDALVQAARLYLERDLPRDLATWLADRLTREGPITTELGHAFRDATLAEAGRRAQRAERLGLFKLAALELEGGLSLAAPHERGQRELEVATLRAKAGDVHGAVDSFQSSARAGGERRPTALLRFARTLLDLGEKERAADALDLAEAALGSRPPNDQAQVRSMGEWLVLRAKSAVQRGDLPAAAASLQRARDLADQIARADARTSRGLQALVQETRAELALATGDREAARTNFRQARDAFRDLGLQGDALRCLIALGEVELQLRDLRRAADTFRAASRLASGAGLVREEILADIGLGETEIAMGELDDGSQRLRGAFRRVTAEEEDGTLAARAALGMAHALCARRLFADVSRYTERARAMSKSPAIAARAALVEAQAFVGQDQLRKARQVLELALEAARAASDALLVERVRQLRAELDRHEHAAAERRAEAVA